MVRKEREVQILQNRVIELERQLAETQAGWLARLPGENPNPVVRASNAGIVLYHNPPAANLPGWTCAMNEPLPVPLLPLAQGAMAQGKVVETDVLLGERFYSVSVVPILDERYANLYGRDITERKRAEDALREGERRLNRAQEIAHLGSWELDLANNRLTWSDEVYRIFGLQPQEFGATYEAFLEAVHPDDRAAVDNAYSSSIRAGRDIYEIEHRVVRRSSGEVRIVHEKCEHFRNQGGQIIRSVGMVHDITERKRVEEQLQDYAERLEHSNRELEQFAFMASHDLQEPLRKIETFGDLLLERATQLDERGRDHIERMRKAAGRMRDMVEGLLQLSRVTTQGQPFIGVDLSQVTVDVLSDLEDQIRRVGGKVNFETLPVIEGDPLQLHQLMQNLIGNALKYHEPETSPEVNIHAKQLAGKVQILVEDQGIGFEQEAAERIFQPFQRLVGRSQYEGSGMGLAICRRIVERHGGEIAAFSKPGQGTTLIVTLPSRQPEGHGTN